LLDKCLPIPEVGFAINFENDVSRKNIAEKIDFRDWLEGEMMLVDFEIPTEKRCDRSLQSGGIEERKIKTAVLFNPENPFDSNLSFNLRNRFPKYYYTLIFFFV